ncbi:MAG: hypothetical protein II925_03575, partial [Methanomicrobium sp.]|nr:hypothetical protein [Methanomicrobium sp.]
MQDDAEVLFEGVLTVAKLMAVSARTAPKAKGSDVIVIRTVYGNDLKILADSMRKFGEMHKLGFFSRDANNVENSDCCLIIGAKADAGLGLNCGACGYRSCAAMGKDQKRNLESANGSESDSGSDSAFVGPNCAVRAADLGIALGSAAKTAAMHNVDNRIMYSAGVGALKLGWLDGCTTAY